VYFFRGNLVKGEVFKTHRPNAAPPTAARTAARGIYKVLAQRPNSRVSPRRADSPDSPTLQPACLREHFLLLRECLALQHAEQAAPGQGVGEPQDGVLA
jgi:hypothetical protein